jgi:hypothetical protein
VEDEEISKMGEYLIKKLIRLKNEQYLLQIPKQWVEEKNSGSRIVLIEVNNVIKIIPSQSAR